MFGQCERLLSPFAAASHVHQESLQNVHIDHTLINSVPVMNNIGSVGYMADTSSTRSGQHSDHIMSVQHNSPQAFNDHQSIPETMLLNAQQIDTSNVQTVW
jgi:hypothetical protein